MNEYLIDDIRTLIGQVRHVPAEALLRMIAIQHRDMAGEGSENA